MEKTVKLYKKNLLKTIKAKKRISPKFNKTVQDILDDSSRCFKVIFRTIFQIVSRPMVQI